MPLYEYECDVCQHRFEKIQRMSDPLVDTCPVCGGAVHKRLSAPAIQFKGSGFYITDYVKKDQPSAKGEKSETGETGEKAEKGEKGDAAKAGGAEKSEKVTTSDKSDKSEKPAASSSSKPEKSSTPST
jgi:putative FmdB family regulatory protein